MRRLLALLGGIALLRVWLSRRRWRALPPAEADPRAEELRQRLEESRSLAADLGRDQEEFAAGETPVDAPGPEERRREVHERGRAAVDEMRGDAETG